MPSTQPDPTSRPSWRPRSPAAAPAPLDERRWRREPGAAGGATRRWGRRGVFGLMALSFLACIGVFVWAVFWFWPPAPARLILVGAGYETNLAVPPNVYGREGLHALASWAGDRPGGFAWTSGLLQLKSEPTELLADARWDRGLEDAGERTVMIVFALHGGADAAGPYLLHGDAAPTDGEKGRLHLTDILERLKRLPARTNKLVVLDATGMGADWSLAMLHNDFAGALDGMESEIAAVPNLAVVSASGADQVSWADESARRTVFGRCLIQGLQGGADENADGRINAWELYHNTAEQVERWTRANRDAIQTPVLLPHGAEGERRARAMFLTLVADRGAAADAPAPVNIEPLRNAWEHTRELSRLTPPPARYAPYAWARYQAIVLRYEQLLRAGDADHAAVVAGMLPELEQQIRQSGRLPLTSAENTLAMTALVAPGPAPDGAAAWFNTLWAAKPEELHAKWDELQARPDGPADAAARQRLRSALAGLAIDAAARNPADLDRAARVVHLLNDPQRPAAAESHFLAMLAANLPQTPPADALLTEALRLRRQAEQAALTVRGGDAPYSEQVYPWINAAVEAADRQRQLGQDLLFAPESGRPDETTAYFSGARTGYEHAAQDGAVVATALDARDRAFAGLPAFARWVALRPAPEDAAGRLADEKLLAQAEKIAGDAHRLDELLAERPTDALALPPALAELAHLGESVRDGLKSLEARFLERADAAARADGPRARQEAEAALTVPFSDGALRQRLIENNRAIDERAARLGDAGKTFPISLDRQHRDVADQARRQGRTALAIFGRRRFDERAAEQDAETYEQTAHRLEVFTAEQNGGDSLAVAGQSVGAKWRRLRDEANAPATVDRQEDLASAHGALHGADRAARLLDGAEAPRWDTEPAGRLLRLSTHDLLLWQAHRTVEDHWFGEKGDPYYQQSARMYLEDARRLVGPAQVAGVRLAEEEVNRPGRLTLVPPGRLALTSELELPAEWTLAPAPGAYVPPSLPSFHLEAGPAVRAAFNGGHAGWIADLSGRGAVDPIAALIRRAESLPDEDPMAAPTRRQAEVVLHGFFRGQTLEARAPVEVEPIPQRVYYELPPPHGRAVSVRADHRLQEQFGPGGGAVAIVLDCSGSMGQDEANPKAPRKIDQATRALETVLHRLPRGTTVSLRAFGQAVGGAKSVTNPEEHLAVVQEPVVWDPDDADQVKTLMDHVHALEPWNETPLVRAMLEAKDDLAHARGFRTLLVLTDGMDNRFDKDPQFKGKTIPRVVKDAFENAGIVVNIVGFRFAAGEQDKAYEQFKTIEELPLPGRFVDVEDADKLAGELEELLRQRIRYWVERDDGEGLPEVPEPGLDISLSGGGDQWFSLPEKMPSTDFKLRVRTNQTWRQSASIADGELLPLELEPAAGGRHALRRVFVTQEDYGNRPEAHTDAWRLAVLQNQSLADKRLRMLVMLEKAPTSAETVLRQVRPREVWMEMDPADGTAAPFGLRWGAQDGYGAPAYSLDATAWPTRAASDAPARPVVRTWWSPDEVESDAHVERDPGLPSLLGLHNYSRTADGVTVVIESVEVERRSVEVSRGKWEPRDCLVVRLSHPPGRPFKVEPVGITAEGQEQHFYAGAGKTTALFWPVSAEQAHDALSRLNLISLERFKAEAKRKGYYLEVNSLKEPTRGDARPLPPGVQ